MTAIVARSRGLLAAGVLIALPLAITVWVVALIFGLVNSTVSRSVAWALRLAGVQDVSGSPWAPLLPLAGLLVSLALLMVLGFLGSNFLGRRLLEGFERLVLLVPFVRAVYGGAKQLIGAFASGGKGSFRDVVALEYPRPGIWVIGFVTSSFAGLPGGSTDGEMLSVFVPTTPNPTSGFLFVVSATEVRRLEMSVEDAIKLIVSGGLVVPEWAGAPALVRPGGA